MAASLINGIQSKGVGTSLKHFAANNQEYERFVMNAAIDERTLHEIYLPAFETAVKKAKPWTVMCAYNKINGVYGSENYKLLTDILKKEWGFEGLVVSDWGAVHDRVAALKAGLDWQMPGPREMDVRAVVEAVRNGSLPEVQLNEAVRRILNIVFKAAETRKGGTFDVESHHALARRISAESVVLLKNDGILPLANPQHIAVIGRSAREAHFQGGGSSHINPTKVSVPYKELQQLAGNAELTYAEGYPKDDSLQPAMIEEAVKLAQDADVALLYIALPSFKEAEGYDRPDLDLTEQQVALIKAVGKVQPKTIVVLNNGAPVDMRAWINDTAALLESWMMGQSGGGAIADVLFGKVNPSGKLSETFPMRLADTPAYTNYPGENGEVHYSEGLFIGYRWYDAREIPVLFPFGYGLSYTTFQYGNPKVSAKQIKDVDGITVSIDVTNTGKLAGKEVVQVYVHDRKSKLVRPPKELKGFAKIELQPGETKTVNFALDFRSFAYYDPAYKGWVTEDGDFDILIGSSSADIRFSETVTLSSSLALPCLLNRESTIRDWMNDPRGREVFQSMYDMMAQGMRSAMGSGDGGNEFIGMDIDKFFLEMPPLSILQFQEAFLPKPAIEIVDELLQQVHNK
jgi:beta-glucosidase